MPLASPCHFFHAFETLAALDEYWMRTAWLMSMYFFMLSSLSVRSAIFWGSETSET